MDRPSLNDLAWPWHRLEDALASLRLSARGGRSASDTRSAIRRNRPPGPPGSRIDPAEIRRAACCFGLEALRFSLSPSETAPFLLGPGARLLSLEKERGFLLLLPSNGSRIRLLTPHRREVSLALEDLLQDLEPTCNRDATRVADADEVLRKAGLSGSRRSRVLHCLESSATTLEADTPNGSRTGWLLRLPPGAPFSAQLSEARLPRLVATFVFAFLAHYAVSLFAWLGLAVLGWRELSAT